MMARTDTSLLNVPFGATQSKLIEEAPVAAPVPQPKRLLEQCPYCRARLSGVEAKMERCLTCGAQFNQTQAAAGTAGGGFIVRI